MKIRALAPWFGGKRTLAPRIVAELGKHSCYWEPCVGGCAVLPAKPKCSHETINDLHGDMTNLLRVVQHDDLGPALFERLLRTVCSDEALAATDAIVRGGDFAGSEPNVDRAFAFYVTAWMGRNGEMGLAKAGRGRQIAVRWAGNGGSPAMRFKHAVDSVPAWWERLRGVTVLRRDLFDVLSEIRDDQNTAIYLDPPYLEKSDRYQYDFENTGGGGLLADDHERMAEACARFRKARVVISYYAHPRLAALYPLARWTVVDCARAKHMSNVSADGGQAPEVLIVNGPSYTQS
jgi:DNA adenine methylase